MDTLDLAYQVIADIADLGFQDLAELVDIQEYLAIVDREFRDTLVFQEYLVFQVQMELTELQDSLVSVDTQDFLEFLVIVVTQEQMAQMEHLDLVAIQV